MASHGGSAALESLEASCARRVLSSSVAATASAHIRPSESAFGLAAMERILRTTELLGFHPEGRVSPHQARHVVLLQATDCSSSVLPAAAHVCTALTSAFVHMLASRLPESKMQVRAG